MAASFGNFFFETVLSETCVIFFSEKGGIILNINVVTLDFVVICQLAKTA